MNVYLPIINKTLVSNSTTSTGNVFTEHIPVWATRPYEIRIDGLEAVGKDVDISVTADGETVFIYTLPYAKTIKFDMSILATVLKPCVRDTSEGTTSSKKWGLVQFLHNGKFCLFTAICLDVPINMMPYVDGPNFLFPVKPRIPFQPYDIILPKPSFSGGLKEFDVEYEPVDDYRGPFVFPTKYYLGNTIDIRYIKKLTIRDPNTADRVAVAEYENIAPEKVEMNDRMLCSARLRWNMRNGQWMWYAFKDYFWNEGFTHLRGLGGAAEQGILTVNVTYGKEYYPAFQELLVSSNILLTLPKQYPTVAEEQHFKMEVTSDTGARWSGSERMYRQQITLRTIGFMDNYIAPDMPLAPAKNPVDFSATPLTHNYPYYADNNAVINVSSNVQWDLLPDVNWLSVVDPVNGEGPTGSKSVTTHRTWNRSTTGRIGTMKFYKAGTKELLATVNVSQAGAPPVNVTPKFLPVSPEGELKSFEVSCNTLKQGTLQVKNMSGASGAWANLDASGIGQDGGTIKVNPARNLPETGGVPRSCIIRTTHNTTGQFADVNVMQSVACPVDRFPNDFAWAGKGMYAYDGNAHNDNEHKFTSGIPYTDMVGECGEAFISNIRIVRVEPNTKLVFNMAVNSGTGANVDRTARIKIKHVPTGKVLGTLVVLQRAYSAPPANFVHASWEPTEAADGSMHYFELVTAASETPTMNLPSQLYLHNIDSLKVNGVQLNKFRIMLDLCLFARSLQIGMSVTGASKTISIGQFANADAMAISTNAHWNRLAPVWVTGKGSLTFNVDVQAQKLNQRDEISFFRLDSWISLQSTEAHQGSPYVRRFTINLAANTTGAARGTEIRFQRPEITDIIIRIEQAG